MVDEKHIKKIGIFGGTFDPVHLGHIGLAADAKKEAGLDKVIFVPAKLQPFKLDKRISSGKDRIAMLNEALLDIEGLEVSSYELDSGGVSYTYLTIRAMKEKFGVSAKIYFIMGSDSFMKIESWRNSDELLTGCSYIIGTRPGSDQDLLEQCMERVRNRYGTEIIKISNVRLDISSTEIRHRLDSGTSCSDLIPDSVERYIIKNGLYKG